MMICTEMVMNTATQILFTTSKAKDRKIMQNPQILHAELPLLLTCLEFEQSVKHKAHIISF